MSKQGTLIVRHEDGTEDHLGRMYENGTIWMYAGYTAHIKRVIE